MKINNIHSNGNNGSLIRSPSSVEDAGIFKALVGGRDAFSNINRQALATAEKAAFYSLESSRKTVLERVVNQKNAMLLESRGSSAKKATEIAKDISF